MPRKNRTPSYQPRIQINTCNKKRRFPNERQALEGADYQMLLKPELELGVYKCELCDGWHLTNKNKK